MPSVVHTPVARIALICKSDEAHVRKLITRLNAFGFESLNPKCRHWPPENGSTGHP